MKSSSLAIALGMFLTTVNAAVLPAVRLTRDTVDCPENATAETLAPEAASAEPATAETTLPDTATNSSTVQFQQAMGNLSYMFGWQMAGSALSDDELDVTCANPANTGHGHWAAELLIPEDIREPICNASHTNPNATWAVPYALTYRSDLFLTQLLSAFDATNTTTFEYLCNNLRFLLLDGFFFDDARIINATCDRAGLQLKPRPEQPVTAIDTNVTSSFTNTASVLYGLMFASSASSDSQLSIYCAHASSYVTSLNTLMLNGTLVASTICNVTEPMSADAGYDSIRTLTTRMFITAIENASSGPGYLDWLCSTLDTDGLEDVGLDGQDVQYQVCNDAKLLR